ncbi:MAG: dihydropteroate synthase [Xanthomonadales bacterium]|nr:dihydropteroate synthase [Xanthomonadales bacterium]MDH4019268.1 dihydropteroate synthase [Xanthomonadales bacterium]
MTFKTTTSSSGTGRTLDCAGKKLVLDRTRIMGILNLTPDSFSDGGLWLDKTQAIEHSLAMQGAGADIIDVGGESTRPGAQDVSVQQELDRVIPVIESIVSQLEIPVSIDTSKPEVMREAVSAGAGMINDVYALRHKGALAAAAKLSVPVCLMHMLGNPRVMQNNPVYDDVGAEVTTFLLERARLCESSGVSKENIVLDPGFGFGKTLQQNIALFHALPELMSNDFPLLVGVSRKTMIGQMTGREIPGRVAGSITAAALAARMGVAIVRVHDVAETSDALKVATALSQG